MSYDWSHTREEGEKLFEFPMLNHETEEELLESDWWKEVALYLKQNRHGRCDCCREFASHALPTKVDSEVYLGMNPGFIASLCSSHYNMFLPSSQRNLLADAMLKNSFHKYASNLWKARHRNAMQYKRDLIILIFKLREE